MSAPVIDAPEVDVDALTALDHPDLSPGSAQWRRTATASKVAAMLGMSTHDSMKSMWLKMAYPECFPRTSNAVQRRGHYLEPGMLDKWFDEHPEWERLSAGEVTFTRDDLGYPALATPDCWARHRVTGEIIVIDIKTVGQWADHFAWGDPGTDVIPFDYYGQGYWQLIVSKFTHPEIVRAAYIKCGPMIDDQETYWITYDPQLAARIEFKVSMFMQSLAEGKEPENDTRAETFDAIRRVSTDITKGLGENWAVSLDHAIEYGEALFAHDAAEGRLNLAKSNLFQVMGKARRAVVDLGPKIGKSGKPLKGRDEIVVARRQMKGATASLVRQITEDQLDILRDMRAKALEEPAEDELQAAA